MGTKSREVIWGSQILGAKTTAKHARQRATEAVREADRAEAYRAWSVRMEGYGGPAQPSPTIGQCLNGGLAWLEVECNRCKARASLPLSAIRRRRETPISPVHLIKLAATQEITPYKWVHPDEER